MLIKAKIDKIEKFEFKELKLKIIYKGESFYPPKTEFELIVPTLHDKLFSSCEIIFFKEIFLIENYYGIVEIHINSIKQGENTYEIYSGKYAYNFKSYNLESIGKIYINFTINYGYQLKIPSDPIFNKMFAFIGFKNDFMAIKEVFFDFFKGTNICRYNFLKGLFILEVINRKYESITEPLEIIFSNLKNKLSRTNADNNLSQNSVDNSLSHNSEDNILFNNSVGSSLKSSEKEVTKIDKNYKFTSKLRKNENNETNTIQSEPVKNFVELNNYIINKHTTSPFNVKFKKKINGNEYKLYNRRFYEKMRKYLYYSIAIYTNYFLKSFIKKICSVNVKNSTRKYILEYLGIPDENLLVVNLKSRVKYIIFKAGNELVISFRGTETPEDAVNDIECVYTEFFNGYAHAGILELAVNFVEKEFDNLKELVRNLKPSKLVLTGQSLGGGISILVYIILKKRKLKCKMKCITFSTPPVLSKNFIKKYKKIQTAVFDTDFIPRISFGSVLDLKYLSISLGEKTKLYNNSYDEIYQLKKKITKYLKKNNFFPKLYIPGTIYHFINANTKELKEPYNNFYKDIKTIGLVFKTDTFYFESLNVDRFAILHHMPWYLIDSMNYSLKFYDEKSKIKKTDKFNEI